MVHCVDDRMIIEYDVVGFHQLAWELKYSERAWPSAILPTTNYTLTLTGIELGQQGLEAGEEPREL
jgi:hypothetical protein